MIQLTEQQFAALKAVADAAVAWRRVWCDWFLTGNADGLSADQMIQREASDTFDEQERALFEAVGRYEETTAA